MLGRGVRAGDSLLSPLQSGSLFQSERNRWASASRSAKAALACLAHSLGISIFRKGHELKLKTIFQMLRLPAP